MRRSESVGRSFVRKLLVNGKVWCSFQGRRGKWGHAFKSEKCYLALKNTFLPLDSILFFAVHVNISVLSKKK